MAAGAVVVVAIAALAAAHAPSCDSGSEPSVRGWQRAAHLKRRRALTSVGSTRAAGAFLVARTASSPTAGILYAQNRAVDVGRGSNRRHDLSISSPEIASQIWHLRLDKFLRLGQRPASRVLLI